MTAWIHTFSSGLNDETMTQVIAIVSDKTRFKNKSDGFREILRLGLVSLNAEAEKQQKFLSGGCKPEEIMPPIHLYWKDSIRGLSLVQAMSKGVISKEVAVDSLYSAQLIVEEARSTQLYATTKDQQRWRDGERK